MTIETMTRETMTMWRTRLAVGLGTTGSEEME
jgi:hypothetical protein